MREPTPPRRSSRAIRRQLVLGSLGLGLLLILAGGILFWQVNRLNQAVAEFQSASERATTATVIQRDSAELGATITRLLPAEGAQTSAEGVGNADAFEAAVTGVLDKMRTGLDDLTGAMSGMGEADPDYELLGRVETQVGGVISIADTMVRQAQSGQWPSVRVRMGVLLRDQQGLDAAVNELVDHTSQRQLEAEAVVADARRAALLYPSLVVSLAALVGLFLAWRTTRSIAGPVEQLTTAAMRIAAGAREERVPVERRDELGQLAEAFNQMAEHVAAARQDLEQQVIARTTELAGTAERAQLRAVQLQTSAEVARAAASTLNLDEMLRLATALISERFGFYHVGVFLLDESGNYAELKASNSEGGRHMLARGHKLKVGEVGLVGFATGSGRARVALDVGKDAVFFDNPDLPLTRSEMALPLKVRDQVIGALDVQSTEPVAFDEDDVALLGTLADQIAIAIENARSFELQAGLAEANLRLLQQSEGARADLDRLTRRLTSEGWEQFLADRASDMVVEDTTLGARPAPQPPGLPANGDAGLTMPLTLRGETIGSLSLEDFDTRRHWSDEEIEAIRDVAGHVALALDNARLYDSAQQELGERRRAEEVLRQQNEYLLALQETGLGLLSRLDLNRLLTDIVARAGELIGTPHGYIFLAEPNATEMRMQVGLGVYSEYIGFALKRGEAVVGEVWRTGRPLVLNDYSVWSGRVSRPGLDQVRAVLGQPLKSGAEVVGVIGLGYTETQRLFGQAEVDLLGRFAQLASIAIENARLFEQTQRRVSELATINSISRSLASQLELRALVSLVVESVREAFQAPTAYLALYDSQTELVHIPHMVDNEQRLTVEPYPVSQGSLTSVIIQSRRPLLLNADAEAQATELGAQVVGEPARSFLGVPMLLGEEVVGVIAIQDTQQTGRFGEDDQRLLATIAANVSVAVQNVRLFEQTQRRNDYLAAAAEVGRLATSTLDVDALLAITVNLIRERFDFNHVSVFLLDDNGLNAVVRESTGEAGRQMKEARHSLAVGSRSIIGRVTETGRAYAAQDVSRDPYHRPHPLLPETRSELGIPLRIGDRILGALDVQSTSANAFTDDDIAVLQTLADQVAVALDNARSYERERQALNELRELDRLKSQFLANMSHELRTPLNSIIGFSRVILKGIDGVITPLQEQDLNAIYNSGQHLLGLINDILDLSRIEAGKMELTFDQLNLIDLINGVMSTVNGLIKDRPIQLEQDVPADLPLVKADGTRVRQVLLNLLSNAAKFTESGSITVHARLVDGQGAAAVEPHVAVSVVDTGPGIAPTDQAKLFEPFSQVDASPTRKTGGSGLGLAISRQLIEMHGGQIWVESEVGHGSTFTFTLPVEQDELTSLRPAPLLDANSPVVLAVDDNPGAIALYQRYLQPHGYSIAGVTDSRGDNVLEAVRSLQPSYILLDVVMPHKDGWQVLAELKAHPDSKDIPIVVCTISGDRDRAFNMGAVGFLVKPFVEAELREALDHADGPIAPGTPQPDAIREAAGPAILGTPQPDTVRGANGN
jgi:GAF domain-containing protein/CheY-like chemotaxis protein/HAMP domain-containing protein